MIVLYNCVTTYVTQTLERGFLNVINMWEVRTHWRGVQTRQQVMVDHVDRKQLKDASVQMM